MLLARVIEMAATSQFASRYKKDLSTETIRTKAARRKSMLQKENRHKLFEKGRQFGLADVNVQESKTRGNSQVNEASETCLQENSLKQKQPADAATRRMNERREMLQRYKEEKELRKLKEQREKAKKGVFKVGLYKPTASGFLSFAPEVPTAVKPKEKVCANGHSVRPTQAGHKQMSTDKTAEKGKGNLSQRKAANTAKQKKAVKPDVLEVIPSKHEVNENVPLDPVIRSASELKQEQTSVEKQDSAPGRPRTRSFAPQHFVFQPLEGLTTYKVTPMSPSRANAFLSPDAFWDFSKSPVNTVEKSNGAKVQEPILKGQISPDQGIQEQQMPTSLQGSESGKTSIQRSSETTSASTEMAVTETKSDDVREEEHDVPYFRNILQSETERLMSQCLQWDGKLELDIPEDAKDLIRTTLGQTRLLIAERFKQFEGLVDNCEFKRGEKETTCTDLDGFWDMIYFQIEDVNKKFDNLQKLQDNKWQPVEVAGREAAKKKTAPNMAFKPKLGAAGRAAARSRLAAVKAAMRDKMKHDGPADSAYQDKQPEVEKVVFEAGFFRIESPVKSFPGSLSKTPRKSSLQTSEGVAAPRSSRRALLQSTSVLCNPEDATAEQTMPVLKDCHPAQRLEVHQLPTEAALPSGCLEQSISLAVEGYNPVAGAAEGTRVLENHSSELKVEDGVEEMEQSAAEQEDIIMCSPEKDVLSSDRTSIDRNPFDAPMLDAELPFTPLKNNTQKFAAAETFHDLIVFSPLPPSGEK
ncbi:hypothetical protein ASZ78_001303 [Callipepla squamata]|uniref:DLG associated protein 5 n=1 Tax=Callipepla squamata TaxID=9009 RepID=A0A226MEA3_CALSU|nr:hypothetical protein ASZ78_001303 [Callipepla squamata]